MSLNVSAHPMGWAYNKLLVKIQFQVIDFSTETTINSVFHLKVCSSSKS